MKIVIDIPEHTFKMVNMFGWDNEYNDIFERALENSIVLPKGHGRLIDADAILNDRWLIEKYNGELVTVIYAEDIDTAPTIIEADKGETI